MTDVETLAREEEHVSKNSSNLSLLMHPLLLLTYFQSLHELNDSVNNFSDTISNLADLASLVGLGSPFGSESKSRDSGRLLILRRVVVDDKGVTSFDEWNAKFLLVLFAGQEF